MSGRDDAGSGRALELVRALGLRPARVRRGKVLLRCPLPEHDDRRASAAIFDSGVLSCSVCGSVRPFDWVTACGLSARDALALLVELGVLADRRPELASPRPAPGRPRPEAALPAAAPREPAELSSVIADRIAATVIPRRAYDGRLFELRAFLPDVLDRADVGIGRANDLGRYFAHDVAAAADERRLVVPLSDERGRLVGVLLVAPNPDRRAEPKVLALAGSTRVPLVLDEPAAGVEMRESLLVVEGELDALTACSCGFAVVGVPGSGSAVAHAERIAAIVNGRRYRSAILVPDGDEPGRRGFAALADRLRELAVERVVLADVLADGDDVGDYLTRAALAAAGSQSERCAIAGRALRRLIDSLTDRHTTTRKDVENGS